MRVRSRKVDKAWFHDHVNDPYVKLALKEGYRSRAAYKLAEIDATLGLVRPGQVIVDLGAAPGAWSPDGSWVAYYAFADMPSDKGMWVAHVSGSEERYLEDGYGPIWNPDGGWLAYTSTSGKTILRQQLDWSGAGIDGPANGSLIGW